MVAQYLQGTCAETRGLQVSLQTPSASAAQQFMLCARGGGGGAGDDGLGGGRRPIGEGAREAPQGREGKGAQAGHGQDASTHRYSADRTAAPHEGWPAAGQPGSEDEFLRRATDSNRSDLQSTEDAFAEHPCAVLRGPLIAGLLIPGTLLVSESQVLFRPLYG